MKSYRMKTKWPLGFLSLLSFQAFSGAVEGNLKYTWLVWLVWLVYFIPVKKTK